jgi:hypothetical protein
MIDWDAFNKTVKEYLMKHDHDHCAHAHLKYCAYCQRPYCVDCGYEWGYLYHHYQYPFTYTTSGDPTVVTPTVTCSHNS